MEKVNRIFNDYKKQKENLDSEDHKVEMQLSLQSLQSHCDIGYFPRLIEVWMYYDPTDFPARDFIYPILMTNKQEGLKAIEKRIRKRKRWETRDNAPLSDLIWLRDQLMK